MEEVVKKMIETCEVPESVLNSTRLFGYFEEVVKLYKKAVFPRLRTFDDTHLISLRKVVEQDFSGLSVLESNIPVTAELVVLRKLARELVIRRITLGSGV